MIIKSAVNSNFDIDEAIEKIADEIGEKEERGSRENERCPERSEEVS